MKKDSRDKGSYWDPVFLDNVVPTKCEVCLKCWKSMTTGRCLYGGPFLGYVEVPDEPVS